MMIVVFLGPPGAGKGTQAIRVADKYGLPMVSTGDMLREAVAAGSELGAKVKSIMESGDLVDDETMAAVVEDRLGKPDCSAGVLLDGYPRTAPQAQSLDPLLARIDMGSVGLVIMLDVAEAEVVRRISGRRSCPGCGSNYHVTFQPPKTESVCDQCGGDLIQRADDKEDVVRERLSVYRRMTEPLVDYYRQRGVLAEIDGSGTVEEIFSRVDAVMAGAKSS
jgi:adenylate kinase